MWMINVCVLCVCSELIEKWPEEKHFPLFNPVLLLFFPSSSYFNLIHVLSCQITECRRPLMLLTGKKHAGFAVQKVCSCQTYTTLPHFREEDPQAPSLSLSVCCEPAAAQWVCVLLSAQVRIIVFQGEWQIKEESWCRWKPNQAPHCRGCFERLQSGWLCWRLLL